MSILFINACVRENSRTLVLAKKILSDMPGDVVEVNLNKENILVQIASIYEEEIEKQLADIGVKEYILYSEAKYRLELLKKQIQLKIPTKTAKKIC